MEIIGFILAIFVGIALGITGGGGSVIAIPIFVYLLDIDPIVATGYALFAIGLASLAGTFDNLKKRLVNIRIVIIFSIPSLLTVYSMRYYVTSAMPDILFQSENFVLTKNTCIMTVFALVTLIVAIFMISPHNRIEKKTIPTHSFRYPMMIAEGITVGAIAGFIGVGGGFLIVPTLVLFEQLPIKKARSASLMIIALNALIGFWGGLHGGDAIDWPFLLVFTAFVMMGSILGNRLTYRVSNQILKKGFGWFILAVAFYVIIQEIMLN